MKKIIALVLALVMILAFTACGEEGNDVVTKKPGKDKTNVTEEIKNTDKASATDAPVVTTEKTVVTDAPKVTTEAPAVTDAPVEDDPSEIAKLLVGEWVGELDMGNTIEAGLADNEIFAGHDFGSFIFEGYYTFTEDTLTVDVNKDRLDSEIAKIVVKMRAIAKDYLYEKLSDVAAEYDEYETVDQLCQAVYGMKYDDYYETFADKYGLTDETIKTSMGFDTMQLHQEGPYQYSEEAIFFNGNASWIVVFNPESTDEMNLYPIGNPGLVVKCKRVK